MRAFSCRVVRADESDGGEPRSRKRAAVQTKVKERKGMKGIDVPRLEHSNQEGRASLLGACRELQMEADRLRLRQHKKRDIRRST